MPPKHDAAKHDAAKHDTAISEVTAFILIIAVIAAVVGIYVAVLIPVNDANAIVMHEDEILENFMTLKSDIDKLWLMGDTGDKTAIILPLSHRVISTSILPSSTSSDTTTGTLFKTALPFSFNHSDGSMSITASLLRISYAHPMEQTYLNARDIIFEGGAVFANDQMYLSPTTGKSKAILICTNDLDETISANGYLSIAVTYMDTKTYTNVTDLRFKDGTNIGYDTNIVGETNIGHKTNIEDIDTLVIIEVSVDMEAIL